MLDKLTVIAYKDGQMSVCKESEAYMGIDNKGIWGLENKIGKFVFSQCICIPEIHVSLNFAPTTLMQTTSLHLMCEVEFNNDRWRERHPVNGKIFSLCLSQKLDECTEIIKEWREKDILARGRREALRIGGNNG